MIAFLVGVVLGAAAPETALHATWRACAAKTGNNYELGLCGGAYVKAADAQLNAAWRSLMTAVRTEPQTRAALLKEQRAWLAYRAAACGFYSVQSDWGRAGYTADGPECDGGVLERRTAELGAYFRYVGPDGQGSR